MRKSLLITPKHNNERGFILLTALAFLFILTTVGLALTQASIQTFNLSVRHSYTQIAHIASKAAIDYAEEQFELDPNYAGTAEQDLLVNDRYRVTIEVDVLYNESSSSKRVQAFGRVYIPDTANNSDFVRDIKASIIRNGEIIGVVDPADYDPVVWLDANEPSSLFKSNLPTTQYISGLPGSTDKDLVEEAGSNATTTNRGRLFFGTDDIELSYDGSSKGHQWIGLRYRGVQAPASSTISEAYIQFTADETRQAGAIEIEVYGVANDNPGQWILNYSVSSAAKTTAKTTWTPPNWNVVGASGANERVDVTPIVQELVNRSGWNPGQAMAFTFKYIAGSGIRTAEMGGSGSPAPQLYIAWEASTANESTADGDSVEKWLDKSINDNDATLAYGTAPTLQNNQINGLNAVRFSANGVLRSAMSSSMTGNAVTAFMVMRPRTTTATNGRFLSLLNTSLSSDATGGNAMVPFYKDGSTTTLRQRYNASTGRILTLAIDDQWAIYTSRIAAGGVERLIKNASPDNYGEHISSVNYNFNELFTGGTRNGSAGTQYADADIAEVVIYDSMLTCSQILDLENHFAAKYGIVVGTRSC